MSTARHEAEVTGHKTCTRCAGRGIYGSIGTCFLCGGSGLEAIVKPLTRQQLDENAALVKAEWAALEEARLARRAARKARKAQENAR